MTLVFPEPQLCSSPCSTLIIRLLPASLCRQPGLSCPHTPQCNKCCAVTLARGQPGLAFMDQQSHPRCLTSCQKLIHLGTALSPRQVDWSFKASPPACLFPGGHGIQFSSAAALIVSLQTKYVLDLSSQDFPSHQLASPLCGYQETEYMVL